MEIVAAVIEAVMGIMSAWLVLMLLYQLCISFFGFKRNTKNYQDHDPQMRFLVLVPAHNEEAVIADIIDNLEHMEYPRELYDFYILADNCTDRTVEVARRMGANVLESHKGKSRCADRQAHRLAEGAQRPGRISGSLRPGHVL